MVEQDMFTVSNVLLKFICTKGNYNMYPSELKVT